MRKLILILVLCIEYISTYGQITTNTLPISAAQDSMCVGTDISIQCTISNGFASPLSYSNATIEIQFDNITSPTVIGTTAPMNVTFAASSTTSVYTIIGTIPAVPNGLYDIRAKLYLSGSGPAYNTSPVTPYQIYVMNSPTSPVITSSAGTVLCQGSSTTLSTIETGVTYSWSPSGQTTQNINVSAAGTYHLSTTNLCGTSNSNNISITMNPLPAAEIVAATDTIVCSGNTVDLFGTVSNASSKVWSDGETTNSISVSSSGMYYLIASNTCGSDTSNSIMVTVNPTPAVPVITVSMSGDTLYSNYPIGNSWGIGDTLSYYVPSGPGSYSVMYTDTNGCYSTSAPYAFNFGTGISSGSAQTSNLLHIYPNPATDYIIIENTADPITIYNTVGQILITVMPINSQIDISHLEKGIYFLRTSTTSAIKLIKY